MRRSCCDITASQCWVNQLFPLQLPGKPLFQSATVVRAMLQTGVADLDPVQPANRQTDGRGGGGEGGGVCRELMQYLIRPVLDWLRPWVKDPAWEAAGVAWLGDCSVAALPYRSSSAPPAGPCSCRNLPFATARSASTCEGRVPEMLCSAKRVGGSRDRLGLYTSLVTESHCLTTVVGL